ncbi:MAG TPA: hypothetical protein ENK06_08040 [Gammaproteobacteria bacterium]|nr:hypothetical protein [Gammaproteobacteria bacterium]
MREISKHLTTRILAFLFGWGALFVPLHLIHFRFFVVDVVFYAAFFDVLASGVLFLGLYLLILKRKIGLPVPVLVLSSLLALSCGYIFAITVPTVIDRSLSAYLLEKIVQRGGSVRENALNQIFVDEYIPEYRLMDVRLQEALSSGTVTLENGCIKITQKGRRVAGMTSFYRHNLLPKKRRLLDEVTDTLTNPLAHSSKNVDYICK